MQDSPEYFGYKTYEPSDVIATHVIIELKALVRCAGHEDFAFEKRFILFILAPRLNVSVMPRRVLLRMANGEWRWAMAIVNSNGNGKYPWQ